MTAAIAAANAETHAMLDGIAGASCPLRAKEIFGGGGPGGGPPGCPGGGKPIPGIAPPVIGGPVDHNIGAGV